MAVWTVQLPPHPNYRYLDMAENGQTVSYIHWNAGNQRNVEGLRLHQWSAPRSPMARVSEAAAALTAPAWPPPRTAAAAVRQAGRGMAGGGGVGGAIQAHRKRSGSRRNAHGYIALWLLLGFTCLKPLVMQSCRVWSVPCTFVPHLGTVWCQ
jgi:hypothetical protein